MQNRKTYYSIREVCEQTGLEPHVLRYWESEFPQLRPKKNRAGNRAYRDRDIEVILFIKKLLYDEQYTISGAKKKLLELRHGADPEGDEENGEAIQAVQEEVRKKKETVQIAIAELKGILEELEG